MRTPAYDLLNLQMKKIDYPHQKNILMRTPAYDLLNLQVKKIDYPHQD